MKLAGADATRYFAKPDPKRAGLLIFGADGMRVALRRQEVIAALIGPEGEAEMRLLRLAAGDLRKNSAMLMDAMKTIGFFPGPRVVFLEDATDSNADAAKTALADWRDGDATLVVTAGNLSAKSALRKAFDDHRNAVSIGIYDDPPSREEIEATLAASGLASIGSEVMQDIIGLSRELDPGDFRQTIEKIALFKWGDATPLTQDDVGANAPVTVEADVDDILNVVAEARVSEIAQLMRRLEAQGMNAVTLVIGATRHFRALHAAAADPAGPESGLARARPPVFGHRRDRMVRQVQGWGLHKLEQALEVLVDTDLLLRSAGQRAPAIAVIERAFIRLAMLGTRR